MEGSDTEGDCELQASAASTAKMPFVSASNASSAVSTKTNWLASDSEIMPYSTKASQLMHAFQNSLPMRMIGKFRLIFPVCMSVISSKSSSQVSKPPGATTRPMHL